MLRVTQGTPLWSGDVPPQPPPSVSETCPGAGCRLLAGECKVGALSALLFPFLRSKACLCFIIFFVHGNTSYLGCSGLGCLARLQELSHMLAGLNSPCQAQSFAVQSTFFSSPCSGERDSWLLAHSSAHWRRGRRAAQTQAPHGCVLGVQRGPPRREPGGVLCRGTLGLKKTHRVTRQHSAQAQGVPHVTAVAHCALQVNTLRFC